MPTSREQKKRGLTGKKPWNKGTGRGDIKKDSLINYIRLSFFWGAEFSILMIVFICKNISLLNHSNITFNINGFILQKRSRYKSTLYRNDWFCLKINLRIIRFVSSKLPRSNISICKFDKTLLQSIRNNSRCFCWFILIKTKPFSYWLIIYCFIIFIH